MTPEDEAFNEIERRSKVKQDILMHPLKEAMLTAEVAVLTEMVRVLSDKIAELESKQEQGEPVAWVDLTDDDMLMIYGQQHEGKKYSLGRMVQQALKEKNT